MTFHITEPGIYLDVPVEDYFADPCPTPSLTQSLAKILIERSPAHAAAEHPRLSPQEPEDGDDEVEKYVPAKVIGDAAHAFLIGRGKQIAIGEFDSWRSKDAKAFRADAIAAGKSVILDKHMTQVTRLVERTREQLDAAGIRDVFREGHGEVVIAWQEDGLWFRSLIDWMVSPTAIYDFKTSALSCAPHAVGTMMANAGWDIQAAMIERGLDVLDRDGRGRRRFVFIAQEQEPPYALTPCELTESVLTIGRKKLAFAIDRWRACWASGEWPAYPAEICRPEYPGYAEKRWLDREVDEADRRSSKRGMVPSLMGG